MGKYQILGRHPFISSKAYLYDLVRKHKPSIAVETGVFAGASTSFILQAMHDNNQGHLYSIDLPNQVQARGGTNLLPDGKETGWLVPQRLKDRWTLIIGDSKEKLPTLANHLNAFDFFHHDSLHTYDHMMFEFKAVWPHLRAGGILSSDDVDESPPSAFLDFCKNWWMKPQLSKTLWGYRGYAVKSLSSIYMTDKLGRREGI